MFLHRRILILDVYKRQVVHRNARACQHGKLPFVQPHDLTRMFQKRRNIGGDKVFSFSEAKDKRCLLYTSCPACAKIKADELAALHRCFDRKLAEGDAGAAALAVEEIENYERL